MKLIVQIPCLNEEQNLETTVLAIPAMIPGISSIEILVVDDGSTDKTSDIARALNIKHLIRLNKNRGLAAAFRIGLDRALALGADIIVNFDADNQYPGDQIPNLIAPILNKEVDIVIGNRNPENDKRNTFCKRILYSLGRIVVSKLCKNSCPDPVSGFRAFSREAAIQLNIVSSFSYTLETLIQAEYKSLKIAYIPIVANKGIRPSRLFSSVRQFLFYSARTVLETYFLYKPLKVFTLLGTIAILIGSIPILRFLFIYYQNGFAGHIQSLIFGGIFVAVGIVLYIAGIQSHLIARNRILLEQILEKLKMQQ